MHSGSALELRSPGELAHFERRFSELSHNQGQGAAVAAAWAWLAEDAATSRRLALTIERNTAALETGLDQQQENKRRQR